MKKFFLKWFSFQKQSVPKDKTSHWKCHYFIYINLNLYTIILHFKYFLKNNTTYYKNMSPKITFFVSI